MKLALIGSGGHAKEVMFQMGQQIQCFVTSDFEEREGVLHLDKFSPKEWQVMIAIGEPFFRKSIFKLLPAETKFFTFIHPSALIGKKVKIGKGSFVGANSIITEDVIIGEHSLLNRGCQIGHDCKCGDFLSMMPGSILSGNVVIGESFYLGTNSAVREKVSICDNVKVGLLSSVIENIEVPGTYVGCPVKKLSK